MATWSKAAPTTSAKRIDSSAVAVSGDKLGFPRRFEPPWYLSKFRSMPWIEWHSRDRSVRQCGTESTTAIWARSAWSGELTTDRHVCRGRPRHLYLPFASVKLIRSGAAIFDAETYISTQPAQALEEARVPDSHEDQERGRSAVAPPGQGAQARLGEAGFPRVVFPPRAAKAVICAGL